jgi:hypothetical protein
MGISRLPVRMILGLVSCLIFLIVASSGFATAPCLSPDNGSGSSNLPADCPYTAPLSLMYIINGLPAGTTIECTPVWSSFSGIVSTPGGSLGGDSIVFFSTLEWVMQGTGTLSGYSRTISIPVPPLGSLGGLEIHTAPHVPGHPVQSFDTDMFRLQGQLPPGDPDFDLLRVTAGTGFGMPSPGHTTLTRAPSGQWYVDSFFDITYRIDFVGHPGGPLGGMSGSTTATIRMQQGEPSTVCVPLDNGAGTADLPVLCPFTDVPVATMDIVNGLAAGDTLKSDPTFDGFVGIIRTPGGSLGGEVDQFVGKLMLQMTGTGTYASISRPLTIPNVQCAIHTAPRTPGAPVQSFATDMVQFQGQITGDPDFDLLRITGGTGFGMPSPGHTTLTSGPGGTWNNESFFDITYRIDFIGTPAGPLGGHSGSTTGTIRLQQGSSGCPTIFLGPNALPNGTIAALYDQTITASGGTNPYTYGSVGALPPGLTLSGSGQLSGFPTTAGCYTFTVNVTDAAGCPGLQSYTMSVSPASAGMVFLTNNLPPNAEFSSGSGSCNIQFGNGVVIKNVTLGSLTPSSPPPPPGGSQTYLFTGVATIDLSTDGGTTFTPKSAPANAFLRVNSAFDTPPTRFFDTEMLQLDLAGGSLPAGTMIRESPTKQSLGKTSITDAGGGQFRIGSFFDIFTELSLDGGVTWSPSTSAHRAELLQRSITISPPVLPNGDVGAAYDQSLTADGGASPYTFSLVGGALPGGAILSAAGALSGTPTTPGCYSFTASATDATGISGQQVVTVGIAAAETALPAFSSDALPPASDFTTSTGTCALTFQPIPIEIVGLSLTGMGPASPPPPLGVSQVQPLTGQAHFDLSSDGGATFNPVTAPASASMRVAHASDGSSTRFFDTEMLSLDIAGGGLPAGTMIRESPTRASTGKTAIHDDGGGQFRIGSFFDIFTELSLDGGATWTPSPGAARIHLPAPEVPHLFLSVPPETLTIADVGGKFIKPVKRHKGRYPNWANLRDETVAQGGFAPGTSESDSAGGIRVGVSFMERKNPGDPAKPNWKPIKDSAAVYCWIRIGKWNFKKSIGGSPDAIPQTLRSKGGTGFVFHAGPPRGLDSTGGPGDIKRKPLKKEQKKLEPKKTSNMLFAELLAMKLNIAMSALGKTPPGFGDLIFDRDANFLDEMEIVEIAARADTMMTRWQGYPAIQYDSLWSAIYDINRAFDGPLDTLTWEAPSVATPNGSLTVKGQVDIATIPFLRLPAAFVPTRISPSSQEVDPEYDPDEDELDADGGIPVAAKLYQNYPNPFNPSTTIAFRLKEDSKVTIRVFDLLGREIGTIVDGEEMDGGYQTVVFARDGLASGVYFYQIDVQGLDEEQIRSIETRKMLMMK